MALPTFLRVRADGLLLAVKVQPRASRNAVAGVLGDELRIQVTAPPVDSAANAAALEFLADRLRCARRQLTLVRGATSRHKIIQVDGLTAAEVLDRLLA
jgi:hypothetical protein